MQQALFDVTDFLEDAPAEGLLDTARVRCRETGRFGSVDLERRRSDPKGPLWVRWDGTTLLSPVARETVDDLQNFPTPPAMVEAILHPERFEATGGPGRTRPSLTALGNPGEARVVEPACNRGVILDHFREVGFGFTVGVEIDPIYFPAVRDKCTLCFNESYLDWAAGARGIGATFDLVLTNPPFNLMAEYVEASLPLLAAGGQLALLGRTQFLGSDARYQLFERHLCDVHVMMWRESFVESGKTDRWDYAWFVWGWGVTGAHYHVRKRRGEGVAAW